MEGSWGVDILGARCSDVCLGGGARELGWVKLALSCMRNVHVCWDVSILQLHTYTHVHTFTVGLGMYMYVKHACNM